MKHIKRFNESKRDEVKDGISSLIKASGHLVRHEQEIKDEILSFVDELLDDEIDVIHQLAKLEKGEISPTDVDIPRLMEIGQKVNQQMMNIVKKYNKL